MVKKTKSKTSSPSKNKTKKITVKVNNNDSIAKKLTIWDPLKLDKEMDKKVDEEAKEEEKEEAKEEEKEEAKEEEVKMCINGKSCPKGYRCNKEKKCYKLTELIVEANNLKTVLTVDGGRKKTYDINFYRKNIEKIIALKEKVNNKKSTIVNLNKKINDLKKDKNISHGKFYFGTLKDELIIQILYLENNEEPVLYSSNTINDNSNVDTLSAKSVEYKEVKTSGIEEEKENEDKENELGEVPDENTKEYNDYLLKKEKVEYDNKSSNDEYDFLYPELDDPNFNIKIAKRKEFYDTQYDGKVYNIEEQSNKLCNVPFELMSHQLFVKNFLSFQTPYNSLLLYHGLGTGKTCSAIGIAEEMRSYMKQVGISKRILIIAAPNVQTNFRLQLFDERKLTLVNNKWNLNTCIGNSLLDEINPNQMQGLSRSKVVHLLNTIINQSYLFLGYREFGNYIKRKTAVDLDSGFTNKQQKQIEIEKIQSVFNDRLVIIDEVHNIRLLQENKESKKMAPLLMNVCKHAQNMRLLVLSATPMFNSYKEIIWIINLLNIVDKRSTIEEKDIFNSEGEFIEETTDDNGNVKEGGKELLKRKLTGYVSYVRGENPYTFPYRIYPKDFSPENVLQEPYPTKQMNEKEIDSKIEYTPVYMNSIGEFQETVYKKIIEDLQNKTDVNINSNQRNLPDFTNMESFGYNYLREPLQALNMVYPHKDLNNINNLIGKKGLSNIMNYEQAEIRYNYEYKPNIIEEYGNIFHPDNIGKYSSKIENICNIIKKSKGIVMIYSQYIDGGVIPLALALEEMGFSRHGINNETQNLFKTSPTEKIDAITYKTKEEGIEFNPAKYMMITGEKTLSPNNLENLKYITNPDNKNGEKVKVVLITKAAAEGLDFKNIRQLHVLEPWYNTNRTEQIIGRAVRNLSHCDLPFNERNVEIYLHATKPINDNEPADLYVYRYAEMKAIQIGKVSRILKETSVDCLLNIGQTNLTEKEMNSLVENQNINISLSSNKEIEYKIGDKNGSSICDYMDCNFTCSPNKKINPNNTEQSTYTEYYVKTNYRAISKRIRDLFKEQNFYNREQLFNSIQILRSYPTEQIDYVLTRFIENKRDLLVDKYGRSGYLINSGNYYGFQPIEITEKQSSLYDKSIPIDYKNNNLIMELPKDKDTNIKNIEKNAIKYDDDKNIKYDFERLNSLYDKIIQELDVNLTLIEQGKQLFLENKNLETAEDNWYKHYGYIYNELFNIHKIPEQKLYTYIIYRWLDTLKPEQKLNIMYKLYLQEPFTPNSPNEAIMKTYFDDKLITHHDKKGILLGYSKNELYVQVQETRLWRKATPIEESRDFKPMIDTRFKLNTRHNNKIVGFMNIFKNKEIVFKIKELIINKDGKEHVNKGFKCNVMGKSEILIRLNKVLAENPYPTIFNNNQKFIKYDNNNTKKIQRIGLCVITEIILRYYNDNSHIQNKIWFYDIEKTIYNNLVNLKN